MSMEQNKQHTFDAYCKLIVKNEAINIQLEYDRQSRLEVSFSELSQQELQRLQNLQHIDRYSLRIKAGPHGRWESPGSGLLHSGERGRCLESAARLVDEIIIVDTGFTDRTREIAARFTDKIFDFPWRDDFAAAWNESFSRASLDYCMWLDYDDVLPEEDPKSFLALKESLDPSVAVVIALYHTGFDESGRVTKQFVSQIF